MKPAIFRKVFWLLFPVVLASCAAGNYSRGKKSLKNKSYNEAINYLTAAEEEKPGDYAVKRELGIAFYKIRRYDAAIEKLTEARELENKDSKTVFYIGLCYEGKGELDQAIDEYKSYRSLSRSGGFKNEISKRIKQLTNERVSDEIAQAISAEQTLDVSAIPDNTVAVLYFQNVSGSAELDPLQKGLAQMVITDLSKVNKINVVERLRLQKLLEELRLGSTGLVDEQTAPRVGKLLGARKLVKGGFTDLADSQLRIDASLAETTTASILEVDEVTGRLDALFELEKKLVFSVIYDLGITLTREEREAIQKIPTESLLAFMAYSKGLDFEDRGRFDQAKQEYQKALQLDPDFELAEESLEEVEVSKSAARDVKLAPVALENDFLASTDEVDRTSRRSRLIDTSIAAQTGQAPQGDNDTREPLQEDTGADKTAQNRATLRLRIPLPNNQ